MTEISDIATVPEAARVYINRGWRPLPVWPRTKKPRHDRWPSIELSEQDVDREFAGDMNVGIALGDPSHGLVDIDLDTPEAVAVADTFLPTTGLEHGRPSTPRSHRWYVTSPGTATRQFRDVDQTMLVELRSTGGQTVVPPSRHPEGEMLSWAKSGEPTALSSGELLRVVSLTAACTMVARHWPRVNGSRNALALSLSGFLLRGGLQVEVVEQFVTAAAKAGQDEDWQARGATARYTFSKLAEGKEVTGGPTLADLLMGEGVKVVARLRDWLDLKAVIGGAPGGTSPATRLVELALGRATLFHTPDGEPYARVQCGDHAETLPLSARSAKEWLAKESHSATRLVSATTALNDALNTLAALAKWDGPEHQVFTRIANIDSAIHLDLGGPDWEQVRVTASGWDVVPSHEVAFRRTNGMLPLPHPERGGSIDLLRDFINVDDDEAKLATAWLLGVFRGRKPYPVLGLIGEQGTAKTFQSVLLRELVDPNTAPARLPPRNQRDLMIAASNSHVMLFDNLSEIPGWFSDALCCLSTGASFATRELHSDRGEILFSEARPVLLNGITDVMTRSDLVDRSILLSPHPIPEDRRRTESDLRAAFDLVRPRILGALLDAVACALRREHMVKLSKPPRMADFARWVVAAEDALGWPEDSFVEVYAENRAGAVEESLDGDPIADAVLSVGDWTGSAKELLDLISTEELTKLKDWPQTPKKLASWLRRLGPALRRVGLDVQFPKRTRGRRLLNIKRIGSSSAAGQDAAVPGLNL